MEQRKRLAHLLWMKIDMPLNLILMHGIQKPICCSWNPQLASAFPILIHLRTMILLEMTLQQMMLMLSCIIGSSSSRPIKHRSSTWQGRAMQLGNPETCDAEDWKGLVDYAWSHAVVSDETHKIVGESCDFSSNDPWSNKDCSDAVGEVLRQYKEIDIFSLYTSICISNSTSSDQTSLQVMFRSTSTMMPRIMGGFDPCLDGYATSYYNRPEVQRALHVSNGLHLKNWSICNMTVFDNWFDSKESVLPIYRKLIAAGLRIWVYSGDTDGRVPVLSTRYSLSSLGLPIKRPWRPWYHNKQVAGWLQEYEGLTYATFRGAGHDVPTFKPSESLAFFSSFLQGESPPSERAKSAP